MKHLYDTLIILLIITSGYCWAAETHLSGDLKSSTLDASGNPYIIDQEVNIPRGEKITIKSGVTFLFKSFTGINVSGSLFIEGNPENPVVFTSINDQNYNTGSNQLANPFDWNGIFVSENAEQVKFRNFKLMYSVFGIKSRKDDITLQNGYFKQNGQFHFTINDKIIYVQDNFSFSYNADNQPTIVKPSESRRSPEPLSVVKPKTNKKPKNEGLTYTLLTVGLISGVVAGYTGYQSNYYANIANKINDIIMSEADAMSKDSLETEYHKNRKKRDQWLTAAGASGVVFATTTTIALYMLVSEPKSVTIQKVSLSVDPVKKNLGVGYAVSF